MAGTRSSARQAAAKSSPSSQGKIESDGTISGSKRKGGPVASPTAKRGKKGEASEQTTLDETMLRDQKETEDGTKGKDVNDHSSVAADDGPTKSDMEDNKEQTEKSSIEPNMAQENGSKSKEASQEEQSIPTTKKEDTANGESAVEESAAREKSTPSSILEKGIIYIFERGRVGINEPSSPEEIARCKLTLCARFNFETRLTRPSAAYLVLRPLPHGAKLGDGPIGDSGNNRLLALPKKVLPKSPKDRFMSFIEKGKIGLEELKNIMGPSDYTTKTVGTRHTPAMAPLAEGVYAITSSGRETHLAYILTIPSEITQVQQDMGLSQRGSWVTSVKNPSSPGPANANLPKSAEYPQDMLDEFRGLRWMPLQPRHLDYENTQILLIGHKEGALEKAADQQVQDEGEGKDKLIEEMEKLEHEDELRVEHLKGGLLLTDC